MIRGAVFALTAGFAGAVLAVYALDWIVRFESDELGRPNRHV